VTGPIYIDGAKPGDALKITVLSFRPFCGLYEVYLEIGSAAPTRSREQRTIDGSLASTTIERLLSGFRPRERTTAYVCSTS
jgi:hypothetical protein